MVMLLYIIIVIMAFVFGITTSNTIAKEAGVIGTLRASGYTRGELAQHYMTLPVIVTLIGALIGNILGYTAFKDVCAGMYYGSYSLPTCHHLTDSGLRIIQCFCRSGKVSSLTYFQKNIITVSNFFHFYLLHPSLE